jgi:hypothetical protein
VSDASYVLETIAGIDTFDEATIEASKYIPEGEERRTNRKENRSSETILQF